MRGPVDRHELVRLQQLAIGIPNGAPPVLPSDTIASYIPKLADLPLEFQPGTQWHYSNVTGYDVLGRIIEVVSGQSLQEFAKTRLFAPLGMTNTRFGVDAAVKSRLAPMGVLSNEPLVRTDYPTGSAGLFCTLQDYAKFAQMLLQEGLYQGQQVMPAEAVRAMRQGQIGELPFEGIRAIHYAKAVHASPSAFTYGFGVGILSRDTPDEGLPAGSYGWDGVGTRRFWVVPSENLVIIMMVPGMGFHADAAHKEIEAAAVEWARARRTA